MDCPYCQLEINKHHYGQLSLSPPPLLLHPYQVVKKPPPLPRYGPRCGNYVTKEGCLEHGFECGWLNEGCHQRCDLRPRSECVDQCTWDKLSGWCRQNKDDDIYAVPVASAKSGERKRIGRLAERQTNTVHLH